MPVERRRNPRINIVGQLHGRAVQADEPVAVREISLGGMALETPFPFPPDAVCDFQLELGDGSVLDLRARATHSHAAPSASPSPVYVTGFAFVDMDAEDTDDVTHLIDRVK
jgi:hypothetical protein